MQQRPQNKSPSTGQPSSSSKTKPQAVLPKGSPATSDLAKKGDIVRFRKNRWKVVEERRSLYGEVYLRLRMDRHGEQGGRIKWVLNTECVVITSREEFMAEKFMDGPHA